MRNRALLIAAALLATGAIIPTAADGQPTDSGPGLFHVSANSFGCADPEAARRLTDPNQDEPTRAPWFGAVFAGGHCVSITPRSPWRLVSLDGEMALMRYSGDIGPPGSYYMRAELLTDSNGLHPGQSQALPPLPPGHTPSAAAPTVVDPSSPTALAPAESGGGPVLAPQPAPAPSSSTTVAIVIGLTALAVVGVCGYVLGRRSHDGRPG